MNACPTLLPSDVLPTSLCEDRFRAELAASPYPSVRRLHCSLQQDHVVLTGRVPNYYMKQFAQSLLMRLGTGLRLENQLEVTDDDRS